MPPAGFEPAVPTREQPQAHVLDRAATGIAPTYIKIYFFSLFSVSYLMTNCMGFTSQMRLDAASDF